MDRLSPYVQMLPTHHRSWPCNLTPGHQYTHCMRCALPIYQPHASLGRTWGVGGWAERQKKTKSTKKRAFPNTKRLQHVR